MTDQQIQNIYTAFKTLPPEAKEWLTSENVSAAIEDIGRQYVLSSDQKMELSFLIMRLTTQDISPNQFTEELSRALSIEAGLADTLTAEIKNKIFSPIEKPLRFAGIDIDLLSFRGGGTLATRAPEQTRASFISPTPASTQQTPFILHQEPSTFTPPTTYKPFIFTPQEMPHATPSAPPKVIIERVVHYNALRTPLAHTATYKYPHEKKVMIPKSKWFTFS